MHRFFALFFRCIYYTYAIKNLFCIASSIEGVDGTKKSTIASLLLTMNSMTTNPMHTNQGGKNDREGRSNQDDKPGSNKGGQGSDRDNSNRDARSSDIGQQGGRMSDDTNRDRQ